jgi:hypothetical protein
VRDLQRLDVPELRELCDVGLVLPVAKAGEIAVAASLTRVLRRRLTVHLQDPRPRHPDHPAQQIDVVRGARGRRRLMRLVDALKDKGEQALRIADDLRCATHVVGADIADLGNTFWRIGRDRSLELVVPDRVRIDERVVDVVVRDQLLRQPVEDGEVRARPDRKVNLGLARRLGLARVDHDRAGWVRTA